MKKVKEGELNFLPDLQEVHFLINHWFEEEANRVLTLIDMEDITGSEMVRIHHHEIHKKRAVRSSILQLESKSGTVIGHDKCAELLTENAASFLEQEILLDAAAQNTLLDEISPVFTDEDNLTLIKTPDNAEVLEVLKKSNLHAAPGTDGITNYFYL